MGSGAPPPAVGTAHFWTSVPTLAGERTFSKRLKPELALSKWYRGQLVRTKKEAWAVRSLLSPVAVTAWVPGEAVPGTWTVLAKVPVGDVVGLPMTVSSKVMSTT